MRIQREWGGAQPPAVRSRQLALLAAGAWCLLILAAAPGCRVHDREADEGEARGDVAAPGEEIAGLDITHATDRVHPFAPGLEESAPAAPPAPASPAGEDTKRLLIYKAAYEVLVANVNESVRAFLGKVEGMGGYLQKREGARVACRVPARRFHELVAAIPSLGVIVKESLEAEDVTRQYLDLALRIENAEKSRQRLLAILEKADKVEDVLKIEADIRRLTEEIERFKGELKYLADQIAYSTVEVLFRSLAPEGKPARARERSRFAWLNQIGVEHVLEEF